MTQRRTVAQRLQTRLDHLSRLEDHQSGRTVDQANDAFRDLCAQVGPPSAIYVRRQFLRRETFLEVDGDRDTTPRSKPPMATLIRPRGIALKLELTLLFLAQLQEPQHFTAKVRYPVISKADGKRGLIDFFSTGTNRREDTNFKRMLASMRATQVKSALDRLASKELQLVNLEPGPSKRPNYDSGVLLHHEVSPTAAGAQLPYARPKLAGAAITPVVAVPLEFFTNGWIHVLTDSEIANWLMWRDLGEMRGPGNKSAENLRISAGGRLGWYDLTRDAWDTHQTLSRMGLMTVRFAEGRRSDGTLEGHQEGNRGEPHLFGVDDEALTKPAVPSAKAAIAALQDEALGQ